MKFGVILILLTKSGASSHFEFLKEVFLNINHEVDIYGFLRTPIEFCYGEGGGGRGFAREPLWAPRLLEVHTQIVNIIICKYYIHT